MKTKIRIKNVVIDNPEVFITSQEQAKGFKKNKAPRCGVFVYIYSDIRKFWMQDTPKDLDIVFCCNNKVVSIEYGKAFSEDLVGPDTHCDLVVEFPLGFCKRFGIIKGDEVHLTLSPEDRNKLLNEEFIRVKF